MIAISRLSIQIKNPTPVFQLMKGKILKPIVSCMLEFYHALSELQVIARNSDWFIVLFAPVA